MSTKSELKNKLIKLMVADGAGQTQSIELLKLLEEPVSLRDEFAKAALTALVTLYDKDDKWGYGNITSTAYVYADQMMRDRNA